MTRIDPDDPKWTAYVFGELNEAERAAIELEIEASEEARTLVEELRFAAALTKAELREAVPVTSLSSEQRNEIVASASTHRPRQWFGARAPIWSAGLAAAAAAVIVFAVWVSPAFRQTQVTKPEVRPVAAIQEAKQSHELADQPGPEVESVAETAAVAAPVRDSQAREQNLSSSPIAAAATLAPGVPAPAESPAPPVAPIVVPAGGRLFGIVRDAAGAVIPGVAVTATNTNTGSGTTTTTNDSGVYSFDSLQSGTYRVTASLPGFQIAATRDILLAANAQSKNDITLQVAQLAQVTVEAAQATAALDSITRVEKDSVPGLAGAELLRSQTAAPPPRPPVLAFSPAPPPPATATTRAPGVPPPFDRRRPPFYNGTEAYNAISDNPFLPVGQNPLSTFAVDVDTASYSNIRRYLNQSQLPPRDAVRIEEMVNYFTYDYPQPSGNTPIGASLEAASAPWNPQHRLVRVAIKARDIDARRRPPSNLVFLIDVSGSMQPAQRLPLLKEGLHMLVEQLTANDRVTVVTYAGTTGVALRPTRGDQKDTILSLIDSLQAGGSTNGGSGIQLAYEQAVANFIPSGINRVILATDGDFNVGITDRNSLLRLIEDKAKSGVFLSVLGVGMGNYKDATLETLADKGHGNYAYLDTLNEARKVLVEQMSATLVTMAKDVKVQVEFNPAVVGAYRLIGYENRALRNEDFNNDLKDGGDMGAGHTVTVLYEVVPKGVAIDAPGIDPLKYQQPAGPPPKNASNETLTVKIRYKEPAGSDSKLLVFPLVDREQTFAKSGADFRFAAAVAAFGMILRESPYKGTATLDSVLSLAEDSLGNDRSGYRREFLQLVQRAKGLRRY